MSTLVKTLDNNVFVILNDNDNKLYIISTRFAELTVLLIIK